MSAVVSNKSAKYVLLDVGGLRLSVPQEEVVSVEVVADVEEGDAEGNEVGALHYAGRRWPVYALSPELSLQRDLSPSHKFCVCIAGHDQASACALACDEVSVLTLDAETPIEPLPQMMRTSTTPVRCLLRQDEALVLMTEARALSDYVDGLGVHHG